MAGLKQALVLFGLLALVLLLSTLLSAWLDAPHPRPPFVQQSPTPCSLPVDALDAADARTWRQLC